MHLLEKDFTPLAVKESDPHHCQTPIMLPESKKSLMDNYYEKHSDNKRKIAAQRGILEAPHHYSKVEHKMKDELEKLANCEQNGYFGIYHVSICQPETVHQSFENFVQRMLQEQEFTQRTHTLDSHFFDEYTIKNFSDSRQSFFYDEDAELNEYREGFNSSKIDSELMMQIIQQ